MRAFIASLVLPFVVLPFVIGLGVAGCGVDSKGFGGTGGRTGGQDGAASGDAGGGSDGAVTGPCTGRPPNVDCAFGLATISCTQVDGWTWTCPNEPIDAAGGTGGQMGSSDGGMGVQDAVRLDVPVASDAPADSGGGADGVAIDAGTACTSSASCAAGQVCTTVDGVCNLPPGCATGIACPAVCYGTCRSADTGPTCGNTICATGTTCCNASCGTCVAPGVGCTKQLCASPACEKDGDCQPVADYCTGCDCRALTKGASLPVCPGPGVRCLVDPCLNKVSSCVGGQCVLAVKN